ncbi:hypothetical protein [Desemzia sp. FAM 23989]|uniref:hypothetical protein n=1 Tax=Desemzia sp. FAM 23989 TaxID=3259523 RepID=UPI0038887766
MTYPEFVKGTSRCAHCNTELKEEYVTVRDNHMILNYFDFENGEDNIFCDKYCLADALSAETILIEEDGG